MSDDNTWDDLFAKAADVGSSPSSNVVVETSSDRGDRKLKNRKRKRNQQSKSASNENNDDGGGDSSFEQMLQSRILPCQENSPWPHWMLLAEPILNIKDSPKCQRWNEEMESSESHQPLYSKCTNCGNSALNHRLDLPTVLTLWPFRAFCELRNLRCTASFLAQQHRHKAKGSHLSLVIQGITKLVSIESIRHSVSRGSNMLSSLKPSVWRGIPHEEAQVIESKLNDVLRHCNLLLNSLPSKQGGKKEHKHSKNNVSGWESWIRLIISCDALYYRMYYLQLIKLLPISDSTTSTVCYYLPHPTQYFGLPFLTMDLIFGKERFENRIEHLKSETKIDNLHDNEAWFKEFLDTASPGPIKDHALANIHRYRQFESFTLFQESGWAASPGTSKTILESLEKFTTPDTRHETPAPDVLMEWRDGCRDVLCNFYAYATLSPQGLERLVSFLNEHDIQNVIELGAGTGYFAKLLQEGGMTVDAWDIHPTSNATTPKASTLNEYHGHTPPFVTVKQGSKLPSGDCSTKALLLCYPPPGSSMAFDALNMYLHQRNGKYLIHVGEFKGLTGDSRFESLLVKQMTCYFRYPCLTWGTDAAHVTIWIKNQGQRHCDPNLSSLLLPCSYCKNREGKRRCRLLRSLVYCSKECFDHDSTLRNKRMQMQCLMVKEDAMDFEEEKHFIAL